MAEVVYWLGDAAETSARVCLRADTAGVRTLTCEGRRYDVVLDPGVRYGIGWVDVQGLKSDSWAEFAVWSNGVQEASGLLRTMPSASEEFNVAFFSCMRQNVDMVALYSLVDRFDVRAAFSLGDMPYSDVAMEARFAGSVLPGAYTAPNDVDTWNAQYLALHRDYPAYRYFAQRVPVYKMWDDHEFCNDFEHSLTKTNATFGSNGGGSFADQAEVDAFYYRARTAWLNWAVGNPACDWPHAVATKPFGADAGTPASNYDPIYFRKVIGPAQFIVPDLISYRGTAAQADSGALIEEVATAKTCMGRPQLRGLKQLLLNSPYAFNPFMSSKVSKIGATTSNNFGWNDYATERNHLIEWIYRNGRGVVWAGGDVHTPFVINDERHAQVNGCPLSWAEQTTGGPNLGSGYVDGYAWKSQGYNMDYIHNNRNGIGLIRVTPHYLDWSIVDERGMVHTTWRQFPNANTLTRIL